MSDALRVTYEIALCGERGSKSSLERAARELARAIAVEQSAELPAECIPTEVEARFVGRVEDVDLLEIPTAGGPRARAVIEYPALLLDGTVPQLLTVLYGNVSLRGDVRLVDVEWPDWLLEWLPGPRFGVEGVRSLLGVEERPLLCTALKPVGLSTADLADSAARFARGGVDLVKDDHGLFDQESSLAIDRIRACQAAVDRVNAETGGTTIYLPNLTAPLDLLADRVVAAHRAGVRGAVVAPFVTGLDALRWLAEESELVLLAHPALAGGFGGGDTSGIDAAVLFGDLLRVLGADGVVYPGPGGRFPAVSAEVCDAIAGRLRRSLGSGDATVRTSWPVLGGGVTVDRGERGGLSLPSVDPDSVVLVGGDLYRQGDVETAARALREWLESGARAP